MSFSEIRSHIETAVEELAHAKLKLEKLEAQMAVEPGPDPQSTSQPQPQPASGPASQPSGGPNKYVLRKLIDDGRLPRAAPCMGRLQFGNHDKLILGQNYRQWNGGPALIFQSDAGHPIESHKPEAFCHVTGPHGIYEIIADVFCAGDKIYVVPESNGQGCKLHTLTVDQNSAIVHHQVDAFEWSHADHDRIDWGAGWKCPRTGRMFLGYGNTQQVCEHYNAHDTQNAHPEEIGKPLKGLIMEWGRPTPGRWDSWSNRLPGYPRSGVVLDDGSVLLAVVGHGSSETRLIRMEPRAWDQAMEPNAGPRAPRKPGYWADTGAAFAGWRTLFDPYAQGGEFNDVIFLQDGEARIYWAYRSEPMNWRPATMRHQGGVGIEGAPGSFWGAAVDPITKRTIFGNGLQWLCFYEAFWENGQIVLQEVANAGNQKGEWNLNGIAYDGCTYWTTGNGNTGRGERSNGMIVELRLV